jgi:hypothetical protein
MKMMRVKNKIEDMRTIFFFTFAYLVFGKAHSLQRSGYAAWGIRTFCPFPNYLATPCSNIFNVAEYPTPAKLSLLIHPHAV